MDTNDKDDKVSEEGSKVVTSGQIAQNMEIDTIDSNKMLELSSDQIENNPSASHNLPVSSDCHQDVLDSNKTVDSETTTLYQKTQSAASTSTGEVLPSSSESLPAFESQAMTFSNPQQIPVATSPIDKIASPSSKNIPVTNSSVQSRQIGSHQGLPSVASLGSPVVTSLCNVATGANTSPKHIQSSSSSGMSTGVSVIGSNSTTSTSNIITNNIKKNDETNDVTITTDITMDNTVSSVTSITSVGNNTVSNMTDSNTQSNSGFQQAITAASDIDMSSINPSHLQGNASSSVTSINTVGKRAPNVTASSTTKTVESPGAPNTVNSSSNPGSCPENVTSISDRTKPDSVPKPGDKRKSTTKDSAASSNPKQKKTIASERTVQQSGTQRARHRQTPATNLDEEWGINEKKRLLEALKSDRGRRWWGRLASQVATKNVDQVKHYTEILRAKANDTTPIHLDEVDSPLQAWIVACERLIECQDDIDAKCIPQVMTIAAVEPTSSQGSESGPNYARIYTFLSGILRGQTTVGLSPVDAKVVLELIHSLEIKVFSARTSEQVNFLRMKFKNISKELEQEQVVFATEELEREIRRSEMEMCSATGTQTIASNQTNTAQTSTQGEAARPTQSPSSANNSNNISTTAQTIASNQTNTAQTSTQGEAARPTQSPSSANNSNNISTTAQTIASIQANTAQTSTQGEAARPTQSPSTANNSNNISTTAQTIASNQTNTAQTSTQGETAPPTQSSFSANNSNNISTTAQTIASIQANTAQKSTQGETATPTQSSSSANNSNNISTTAQTRNGNEIRRHFRRRNVQGAVQSSLNPINVPVSLLNLTSKNKH